MHEGVRNLRYAVLAAAAALVLTGCGDESTPDAGSSPTPPSTGSPTTVSPSLPLTVTRTGGFAGFDDRVVVGVDGIASVSQRGKDPVRCKLDAGLLTTITDAVKQIDWVAVGTAKPTVQHPDDMIIAVSAGGGLARLEDPKVKPLATPVNKLLTEATVPPGNLCKPV
jgi:hypothetical protein